MGGSAGAIRAGRAYVELFAKGDKLAAGLAEASQKLQNFGSAVRNMGGRLMAAGGAITAPLTAAAVAYAKMGEELGNLSDATGLGIEDLSRLKFVAESSGIGIDALASSVAKMQKTTFLAATGNKAAAQSFKALGLDAKRFVDLDPMQQIAEIADKIGGIENPAIRSAMAMKIFGKTGTSLLPVLNGGSRGLEAFANRADELGLTLTAGSVAAAQLLDTALDELWATIQRLTYAVGEAVAPVIKGLVDGAVKVIVWVQRWVASHRDLFKQIYLVAGAVLVLGGALVGLGTAIKVIGFALTPLVIAWTGFKAVLVAILPIIGWLFTPLGAIVAIAAAIGGYFLWSSGAIGKAVGFISKQFGRLASFLSETWKGITDAIVAGNFSLAFEIVFASAKLAWLKGVQPLYEIWQNLVAGIKTMWNDLAAYIAKRLLQPTRYALLAVADAADVVGASDKAKKIRDWANSDEARKKNAEREFNLREQDNKVVAKSIAERKAEIADLGRKRSEYLARPDIAAANAGKAEKDIWSPQLARVQELELEVKRLDDQVRVSVDRMADLAPWAAQADELDNVDKNRDANNQKVAEEYNKNIDEMQKKIDDLKKKRAELIKQAADERALAEQVPEPYKAPRLNIDLAAFQKQMNEKIAVRGTFSAYEAGFMGAGTAMDRVAAATEKTARNTQDMLDEMGTGMTFGD